MIMSDHEDQPTNSIQEVDPQDQQDIGLGGRSYGCIFCKRGFTTAQALGGHMNIHRKDRAKSSSNYSSNNYSSSTQEDHSCFTGPRFDQPVFTSYPQTYISASPFNQEHGGVRDQMTYNMSSASTLHLINHESDHNLDGVIRSPLREEKIMSLRLQFGWSLEDDRDSRRRSVRDGNKEDELDLELRLGHDP